MQRYFIQLQYNGTNYSGWQSQPNAATVQDEIEKQAAKLLGGLITVTGCGRTDAGVHASDYWMHFDSEKTLNDQFIFKMNMMLPPDISFLMIKQVDTGVHARFDAVSRSYEYKIHRVKNPFNLGLSTYLPQLFRYELEVLNDVASLFLNYTDFNTFCKTRTDVKTTMCLLEESYWEISKDQLVYHVTANRFLRGMVRLMVGACINVAMGKLKMEEVKFALDQKERLKKDLSVAAEGLFLSKITYPEGLI